MKPIHEEKWYVAHGSIMAQVGDAPGGDDFVMTTGGTVNRAARLQLGAAAPEMARALLGESGTGHHHWSEEAKDWSCVRCCTFAPHHRDHCDFAAALRKGGVL